MNPHMLELPTGATVSVVDQGTGPAIVLLHGVCMSTAFFAKNIDALAATHRVVAIDFRGHGMSPAAPGGHNLPQYARDVRAVIEALELDNPIIVGWSMGSLVVWDYLAQYADDPRTRGVMIVSQGPSDLTQPGWDHGLATTAELREWLQALQTDAPGFLRDFLPEMFKDERPAAELDQLLGSIAAIDPGTATAILADQTLADYRLDLPSFTTPHLLAWGRDEKLGQLAAAAWLMETLPAAELHVFEQSGHCPMYEEPEAFHTVLLEWAARLG